MELLTPSPGLIIWSALLLAWFFFTGWALWQVVRNRATPPTYKLVWVLVLLFAPFIGAILYGVVGRKQKINHL